MSVRDEGSPGRVWRSEGPGPVTGVSGGWGLVEGMKVMGKEILGPV